MPRGKGTVFMGSCTVCRARTDTIRIMKSKKADFKKYKRYCSECQVRTEVKLKEEKHSS